MRLRFNLLIIILLFVLSANLTFSAELTCCYNVDTGTISYVGGSVCVGSDIFLGSAFQNSYTACDEFEETKMGIEDNGECYETYGNKFIYDIYSVKSYLGVDSLNSGVLIPFDSNICGGNYLPTTGVDGNDADLEGGSTTSTSDNDLSNLNDGISTNLTSTSDLIFNVCRDAGNPIGFFNSEDACNNFENFGIKTCIYSPFLGGSFSTYFVNDDSDFLDFGSYEYGCIPKTSIDSCDDLMTPNSCNIFDNLDCVWVENDDFNVDFNFNSKSGLCVNNNSISENSFFNINEYYDRGNLVKNPSFEIISDWFLSDGNFNILEGNTIVGRKYISIDSNITLSQKISYFEKGISYLPSLYVMVDSNNLNGSLNLKIEAYSVNGSLIDSFTYLSSIEILNLGGSYNGGYFEKVIFDRFVFDGDYDVGNIVFSIFSSGRDLPISLDAVSLSVDSTLSTSILNNLYSSVEIIPAKASNCNLCFDDERLNSCTEDKSNYLGDCSYMVESASEKYSGFYLNSYFGKEKNYLMNSENEINWKSQSIANSQLFCEMYIYENSCLDENNYINSNFASLHENANNTQLCKWDPSYGCYKDSNGDGYPDTKSSLINLYPDVETDLNYFNLPYDFENDFSLACDSIPPISNIYFIGKNISLDENYFIEDYDDLIGDVMIYVEAQDRLLESCSPVEYSLNNSLYVNFVVNGKSNFKSINTNTLRDVEKVKDYFVEIDTSGDIIDNYLKDGVNNISIWIVDQSGNFGFEKSYVLNLDLEGPKINVSNYDFLDLGGDILKFDRKVLPNNNISLEFSDYSKIESCSYLLEGLGSASDNYFSGNFNLTSISNLSKFNYSFNLPIENTSSNGDSYFFTVTCLDIFAQESSKTYLIDVDYNTDLMLIYPESYDESIALSGFANYYDEIVFLSDDDGLNFCNMTIDEENIVELDITDIDYTLDDIKFKKNITGNLTFEGDGVHDIVVNCLDSNLNSIEKYYSFYLDSEGPSIDSFELINDFNSLGVYSVDGKSYTYLLNPGIIKVFVESFGSGLSQLDYNASFATDFGFNLDFSQDNIKNINSSLINLSSFEISGGNSFWNFMNFQPGILVDDLGLYYVNFSLDFFDKAGNNGSGFVGFYFDSVSENELELEFSGDINGKFENKIYTDVLDPNFNLKLNAAPYRNFNCVVSATVSDKSYQILLEGNSSYNFKLSDIRASNFDFVNDEKLNMNFDCVDVYGLNVDGNFDLIFDDVVPILNDVNLMHGNDKFRTNEKNFVYSDIVDSLVFDLEDLNDDLISCDYRFYSLDSSYICNDSLRSVDFSISEPRIITDLNILTSDNSVDAICYRTDDFYSKQINSINLGENFLTKIYVDSSCYDQSGFKTNSDKLEVQVNYVSGGLVDINLEFDSTDAVPVVRSIRPYEKVVVSFVVSSENYLAELNLISDDNGVFIYSFDSGIDKSLFSDGKILYALGIDSSGKIEDTVFTKVDFDFESPILTFNIPELDNLGYVYSDIFELDLKAIDFGVGVSKVELFVGSGIKIFSMDEDNVEFMNDTIIFSDSLNYFEDGSFNGKLYYSGAEVGDELSFKFIAYDRVGNEDEKIINLGVKDGVGIKLLDSNNSLVDVSRMFLVTKSEYPNFKFETSKSVTSCSIYPFVDVAWVDVVGNKSDVGIDLSNDGSNIFEFDLSSIEGYNLEDFSLYSSPVKIVCNFDGNFYTNYRDIVYLNYLPDYVLSSSEGFILTNSPYSTILEVLSVGPYKPISCIYSIDGGVENEFKQGVSTRFTEPVSFDSNSGEHILKLNCVDVAGNIGPEKEYLFLVNKTGIVSMSNYVFESNGFEHDLINDEILVSSSSLINLKFDVNIEDGVGCNYQINPSGSIISGVISFFNGIFDVGVKEIPKDIGNEFRVDGLSFVDSENILKISCIGPAGETSNEFRVLIDDSNLNVSVDMVGLN